LLPKKINKSIFYIKDPTIRIMETAIRTLSSGFLASVHLL
jgi:hypothetical protein